jgi:HEAT repeat protein
VVADPMVRWAVGNALAETADHTVFAEIADLITDRSYGIGRQMLVHALARIGGRRYRARVVDLLIELLDDDDVVLHALHGVQTLKITSAVPKLDHLSSSHPHPRVRRTAQKALTKLGP